MKARTSLLLAAACLIFPSLGSAQIVEYYSLDAIGNVRVVTDQQGKVIERHDYLPFGEECVTGPCASNPEFGAGEPRKFTGKERDTESGLDYFGARYYGSKIGRFTTTDPGGSVTLGVSRQCGTQGAATIPFASSEETAVPGVNYGEVSGILGFADGEAGPKSITVPILDDGFITCSGLKFQVTLGAPTGAGVSLRQSEVLIEDGDQGRTQFRRTFEVRDRILATGPQWQAAVGSESPWLTLSSYTGTGPSEVQAIVDITGLSVGQYVGIITVNAAGAVNSPAQLEVDLTVLSGGSVGQARSSASRPSAPNTPKNGGRQ